MSARNANTDSEIKLKTTSLSDIDSLNVGPAEGVLTTKIRNSAYNLVVIRSASSPYRASVARAEYEQRTLVWLRP